MSRESDVTLVQIAKVLPPVSRFSFDANRREKEQRVIDRLQ